MKREKKKPLSHQGSAFANDSQGAAGTDWEGPGVDNVVVHVGMHSIMQTEVVGFWPKV
jgi:hypothetical protein